MWQHLMRSWFVVAAGTIWLAGSEASFAAEPEPPLIPRPKSIVMGEGRVTLGPRICLQTDAPQLQPLAAVLAEDLRRLTPAHPSPSNDPPGPGDILLQLDASLQGDAYTLEIADQITVTGGTYRAVAWGTATILQALSLDRGRLSLPRLSIKDDSDIRLRSAVCDIARKWHPIINLYELIDLFRYYKISHIQLHLNDHGLFSFGSEKFPQLATVNKKGQVRHYTLAELRDLVAYADARGVTVIPEMEMPGHTDAPAILPEVFGTRDPDTGEYKRSPYINVTRDDTVEACRVLLNEVMNVFASSEYLSIGADEVADARFKTMSEYAQFEKNHPGEDPFKRFLAVMNDTAKSRGKTLLVYGRGGPLDVLQMPWSGNDNELASRGYRIMPHNSGSVTNHVITAHQPPYNTFMLYSGFKDAYEFDFATSKQISPEHVGQVAGIHTLTWQHWHYMHFADLRRLMASLSENAWNYQRRTSFAPFARWRDTSWIAADRRLDDLVFPVKVEDTGLISPGKDLVFHQSMTVTLSSPRQGTIRYRVQPLDYYDPPALPTAESPVYDGPITLTTPTVIYARLFDENNQPIGYGTERRYYPIVPVVTCRAWPVQRLLGEAAADDAPWSPAQPHNALAKGQAQPLPTTLAELERKGVAPTYTFPMGRLSFQPSYEGIYLWGWFLVLEADLQIPADGDYTFFAFGDTVNVSVGGQPAAANRGQDKATHTLPLSAGRHRLVVVGPTGHKGFKVVEYQGPKMDQPRPVDELLLPLPGYGGTP